MVLTTNKLSIYSSVVNFIKVRYQEMINDADVIQILTILFIFGLVSC